MEACSYTIPFFQWYSGNAFAKPPRVFHRPEQFTCVSKSFYRRNRNINIFHSNFDYNVSLNSFPEFYINIFHSWKNLFAFLSLTLSCLRSQFLWFNKDIKINNKPFHFQDFSKENINFVEHLCKPFRVFKSWSEIKTDYNLQEKNLL